MNSIKAVSLDAFGTILELMPPAPALVEELRIGWGLEVSEAEAGQALAAEISYYRAHHLDGRDEESLADLRLRCAAVLRENLPAKVRGRLDAAGILPAMMRSLRFRPYPDVPEALERFRDDGLPVVVVSNWDVSLTEVLERCDLSPYVDHVVSSAAVGAAKPDPEPFERGLELLGLEPAAVVHVGDEPRLDVAGATAVGMRPVLIRRRGETATPGPEGRDLDTPVIASLAEFQPSRLPD